MRLEIYLHGQYSLNTSKQTIHDLLQIIRTLKWQNAVLLSLDPPINVVGVRRLNMEKRL